jgi:indolepyruvate ferredoxin oxidoreductase
LGVFDAEQLAISTLGDAIYTNPLLLGYAWQKGRVPVSRVALLRAMALNGVQVQNNQAAFEWGRQCAHDLPAVQALFHVNKVNKVNQVIQFVKKPSVAERVAQRVAYLTDYQNAAYAETYRALVAQVQQVDAKYGKTDLSEAVARNLFKLMAYKDEYEVARLYADGSFADKMARQFEGDYQLHFHLAPPLWAKTNGKGELRKQRFGPWMMNAFRLLARLKGVRGTALDVFGRTQERQHERAWVARYQAMVQEICDKLTSSPGGISTERYIKATELAVIPQDIRGFGHVKARASAVAMEKWQGLLTQFRASVTG